MQRQQADAEKRFHAQLIEQQAGAEKQVAAERRFQIQLEEIRRRSLEESKVSITRRSLEDLNH